MNRRQVAKFCALAAFLAALAPAESGALHLPDPAKDPAAVLRAAAELLCPAEELDPLEVTRRLHGVAVGTAQAIIFRGRAVGWRLTIRLAEGSELRVQRQGPPGGLRRFTIELHGPADVSRLRPIMSVVAGPDCTVRAARRIRYNERGRREGLAHHGPDLGRVERYELLNPPVPPASGYGRVVVAVVDAGVNYTLPMVAKRLARAPNGQSLGYDFWEMDPRPFDGNPARSPFFPARHGTAVASVLLREAPYARLLPYRYPRPDMTRMAALVQAADHLGVVIVAMPLGSNRQSDWAAFLDAARARPHMLFIISAGNNGRDIDRRPVYPAAYDLDNFLVVSSATASGALAPGSNWGGESVDLLVPAEAIDVTDFYGKSSKMSGSSIAVARVAAMAARLAKKHREWQGPALRKAILARARPLPDPSRQTVKHGWIADPRAE